MPLSKNSLTFCHSMPGQGSEYDIQAPVSVSSFRLISSHCGTVKDGLLFGVPMKHTVPRFAATSSESMMVAGVPAVSNT